MTDAITGGNSLKTSDTLATDPFKGHQRVTLTKQKEGKTLLNDLGEPIVDTYIRPNIPAAKRTDGFNNLEQVNWIFTDCDRGDVTREQQDQWIREQVPVAATYSLDTGGRGLHHYWNIGPQTREVGKALQLLLIRQCRYSDDKIQCPSRLMRAPGSRHATTGKAVKTLTSTGEVHAYPTLKLFPADAGAGGKSTKEALLAAHYLAHKRIPEDVIRTVAEAHGWHGDRLSKVMDKAARAAVAKAENIELGARPPAEELDPDWAVARVRDLVTQVLTGDWSAAEQRLKLRFLLAAEGLDKQVSDTTLTSLLGERTAPEPMQFDTQEADVEEAQFTGPFITGGLNLLVAAAKTGKTWALCELVRMALDGEGEEFAGKTVQPVEHVLFVSLDQGAGANKKMFRAMSLTEQGGGEDGQRSYVGGLTVVQKGTFSFGLLRAWSAKHPGALVIVDSLSAIKPRNLSENDAGMATWLAGFQGLPGDPTVVVVHHAGKTAIREGRTRMDIIRGSGAIQGAVDWVTTLEAPMVKDAFGNWVPDKRSNERRFCGEGRGLEPFEVYVDSRTYQPVPGATFGQDNQGSFGVTPDSHRYDGEKAGGVHERRRRELQAAIVSLIYANPGEYASPGAVAEGLGKDRTNRLVKGLLAGLLADEVIYLEDGYRVTGQDDETDGKDDGPDGGAGGVKGPVEIVPLVKVKDAVAGPVGATEEDLEPGDPDRPIEPSGAGADQGEKVDDEIGEAIREAAVGGDWLTADQLLGDAGLDGTSEQHDMVKRMLQDGGLKMTNGRYFKGDGQPHEVTESGDRARWNLDHLEGDAGDG